MKTITQNSTARPPWVPPQGFGPGQRCPQPPISWGGGEPGINPAGSLGGSWRGDHLQPI